MLHNADRHSSQHQIVPEKPVERLKSYAGWSGRTTKAFFRDMQPLVATSVETL